MNSEGIVLNIPNALSSLYPLILVISLLLTLVFISVFFLLRRIVFSKIGVETSSATPSNTDLIVLKGSRGSGFWAQFFLYVESQKKERDHSELERTKVEIDRLMRENSELRKLQASAVGSQESAKGDRELVGAKLRAVEAEWAKERSIRSRLESQCSSLESQVQSILAEVAAKYKSMGAPSPILGAENRDIEALHAKLNERDKMIESLRNQLAQASNKAA